MAKRPGSNMHILLMVPLMPGVTCMYYNSPFHLCCDACISALWHKYYYNTLRIHIRNDLQRRCLRRSFAISFFTFSKLQSEVSTSCCLPDDWWSCKAASNASAKGWDVFQKICSVQMMVAGMSQKICRFIQIIKEKMYILTSKHIKICMWCILLITIMIIKYIT